MNKEITKNRILLILLSVISLIVSYRMVCFGLFPDEEYQVTLSYRLINGDTLFLKSWDTIQTSSFINMLFIKLFILINNSTEGLIIYLRIIGLFFQAIISFVLYSTIRTKTDKSTALLISFLTYISYPKLICLPDFSNMIIWFMILMMCSLCKAYSLYNCNSRRYLLFIILSGISYGFMVLSQACIIVFIPLVVMLYIMFKKNRLKSLLTFIVTVTLFGIIYAIILISLSGLDNLILSVKNILNGDITHGSGINIMSQSKLLTNIKNTIFLLFAIIIIYTVSFVVSWIIKLTTKNKGINTRLTNLISIISTLLSSFYTLYLWLIRNQGYDSIKLFIPIVFINALIFIVKNGNRVNDLYVEITGIIVSLFVFANIMFISNVPLNNNLTFLLIGLPFAILIISQKTSTPITNAITLNLFITILVGTLFTTMSSTTGNNIFDCNSRFEFGPAKGIIAHEEIVRFYNSEFENFKKYTDNKSVLIVTSPYNNTLMDIFYLENVNISHYSVNSTPTYSQKLYDYWNMFEEKIPDVIVVNNTAVYTWEHDFIFNYLETWYNARFVINTDNCTYYIK